LRHISVIFNKNMSWGWEQRVAVAKAAYGRRSQEPGVRIQNMDGGDAACEPQDVSG